VVVQDGTWKHILGKLLFMVTFQTFANTKIESHVPVIRYTC